MSQVDRLLLTSWERVASHRPEIQERDKKTGEGHFQLDKASAPPMGPPQIICRQKSTTHCCCLFDNNLGAIGQMAVALEREREHGFQDTPTWVKPWHYRLTSFQDPKRCKGGFLRVLRTKDCFLVLGNGEVLRTGTRNTANTYPARLRILRSRGSEAQRATNNVLGG
ncbi:hypothetical protein DM02DRAFT_656436 [Periconia macrospinosa]|uniref:Uncharacterized protein n=1 Tax=Periconia macrospinosa TaxID=97972 RepID=A0A2V1DNF0_9PLEO|nr:hypothetical protein DM02DRAFT_656436 [Periconia macrospinosa]